jgi:hypothetical protein
MHSEDRGLRIQTPQGQLLLFMLCFAGTDVCLDTGCDRDPHRVAVIYVLFNLGDGRCRTRR